MKINGVPEIFSGIFYVYRVNGRALFSEIIGGGEGNYLWMQGEKSHSLKIKKRSVTRREKKAHADFFCSLPVNSWLFLKRYYF